MVVSWWWSSSKINTFLTSISSSLLPPLHSCIASICTAVTAGVFCFSAALTPLELMLLLYLHESFAWNLPEFSGLLLIICQPLYSSFLSSLCHRLRYFEKTSQSLSHAYKRHRSFPSVDKIFQHKNFISTINIYISQHLYQCLLAFHLSTQSTQRCLTKQRRHSRLSLGRSSSLRATAFGFRQLLQLFKFTTAWILSWGVSPSLLLQMRMPLLHQLWGGLSPAGKLVILWRENLYLMPSKILSLSRCINSLLLKRSRIALQKSMGQSLISSMLEQRLHSGAWSSFQRPQWRIILIFSPGWRKKETSQHLRTLLLTTAYRPQTLWGLTNMLTQVGANWV